MSSCNLSEIKRDTFKSFQQLSFSDLTSKMFDEEGRMFFEYELSKKYNNETGADAARKSIKAKILPRIEEWAKGHFGENYSKGFLTEATGDKRLILKYQFSVKLEEAYNRKIEAENQNNPQRSKVIDKLGKRDEMIKLIKDESSVLVRSGRDTDNFYIDLLKTKNDKYFYFAEMQDPVEITKEKFEEIYKDIDGQIASTEEKDRYINQYIEMELENKILDTPEHLKSKRIDAIIEKFYAAQDENNTLSQKLSDAFDSRTDDSIEITERKIEVLKKALNAEVIVDGSIKESGMLLGSNHPLTKSYGKPVIVINPNNLFSDTVIHEFAHLYIDLLGKEDGVLNQAYELLRGTPFYFDIAEQYPELNSENLDKEVLAQAIGLEGDRIFKQDIEALSLWQRIKNYILNSISKMFGIQPTAIEKLAKEMISGNTRLSGSETFNNIITQRSKYKVDSKAQNKQAEIVNILNQITKDFTKDSIDNENVYKDKEGNIYNNSVTKNIKKYKASSYRVDKGDYEIKFDKSLYSKENILLQLNQPKIPYALSKALNDFIYDNIVTTSFTRHQDDRNWLDSYNRELSEAITGDVDEDMAMGNALIKSTNNEPSITFTGQLLKHLDAVLDRAEDNQSASNQAPVVGNIIHNATENYIKNNTPYPSNIIDENNLLVTEIRKIIDNGKKAGSVFLTEQILYSENKQIPGTADLLEITKSGQVKIYDYKTINSFTGKKGKNTYEIKDYSLYVKRGYMHQLLSYGAILNQYGVTLADDPYHIIMIEMDYSNVEDENAVVEVKSLRNKSLSDNNLIHELNKIKNEIFREFASSKELDDINIKPEIQDLNDLANRINDHIKIYKKITKNINSNLDDSAIMKIAEDLLKQQDIDLSKNVNKYVAKNNEVVVNSYLDNIHIALGALESQKDHIGESPTAEYLQSLNYVLQATEVLNDIERILEDKTNDIELENNDRVLRNIAKTKLIIEENKNYYKDKLQRLSISNLASNSNLMQGLYTEKYKLEAKKNGLKGRDQISKYVENKLIENKSLIEVKEINYWTKQYEDGFADLRFLEYLFADPGMSKSQFVQLTKNIMDKSDQAKRNKMMEVIPDINSWYEKLSFEKTGDPKKVWDKFIERKKVLDPLTGKQETKLASRVIPEFISKYRQTTLRYDTAISEHYKAIRTVRSQKQTEAIKNKIQELTEQIEVLKKEKQKILKEKTRDEDDFQDLYVNPEFEKLNDKEKEDLRFIHKQLQDADERIYDVKDKRLVRELEDGSFIFNLPRERKSYIESSYEGTGLMKNFISKFEDLLRPPADEDELNVNQNEFTEDNKFNSNTLDIYGNEVFQVPIYYRNELENESLQSYDIPSLLAMNHQTTITYQENKMVEADLFVLVESLNSKNNDKILKSDSFINKKIQNVVGNNFQKSDQNLVYQAVKSSVENRLYKRSYTGVYSKQNYRLIKGAEAISKYASTLVLAGNFMSALSTFTQGGIYRFLEGRVGEHINSKDWEVGTKKAWLDFPNMLKDTQKFVANSRTELFIKKFGLETQAHALTNKFVQDNFAKKQLDEGTIFSVTSMAEAVVTANLMYSLLSNIKVTNEKGEYINKNGEKVSKNEAMSLDEAYNVVDGKLVLDPNVKYTSFNVTNKYSDEVNKDNTIAATEISRYIRSIYADLYGQYNQDMKSVSQRHIAGKLFLSLRAWLPRGIHRRWRGITDLMGKDFMNFEELRDENNLDKRFYSQDQKQFQEGHYTTSLRFLRSVYQTMKQNQLNLSNARNNVRNTMTDHELANLKRTQYEIGIMLATFALAMLLRVIAMNSGGDDKDKEKIYFAAYLASRINTELATFISPSSMIQMIESPAASLSVVERVFDWTGQLLGVSYSSGEGWDANINDVYEKGDKKGKNKAIAKSLGLIPFYTKSQQLESILGFESNSQIKDSFIYQMNN